MTLNMFADAATWLVLNKGYLWVRNLLEKLDGNEGGWDNSADKSTSCSCREDLSSGASTHSRWLSTACNSSSPRYDTIFWPLSASAFLCMDTHGCWQIKMNKSLKIEIHGVLQIFIFPGSSEIYGQHRTMASHFTFWLATFVLVTLS